MSCNVILQGSVAVGADPAVVRRKFMALTGQTEIVTERLFSGKPTVIKRKVNPADAARIVTALRAIGADAEVEPEAARVPELALEAAAPASPGRGAPRATRSPQQPQRSATYGTLSLQEPEAATTYGTLQLDEPARPASYGKLSLQEPERPAPYPSLSVQEPERATAYGTLSLQEPEHPAPYGKLSLQEPERPASYGRVRMLDTEQAPSTRTLSLQEPEGAPSYGTLSLQEPEQPAAPRALRRQNPVPVAPSGLSLQEPDGPATSDALRIAESDTTSEPPAPAPDAGAPVVAPLPPPPPLEEMYRAVIGPVHTDFYLRHFLRRDAGGPMVSWNTPAVLAQFFWALHRKLWRFAALGLALALIVALLAGYFFSFATGVLATRGAPVLTQIGSLLVGALAGMIVGAFGNDAYQRRALQLIKETAHISDPARRLATLTARGGTSGSWRVALAAAAVGIVAISVVIMGLGASQSSAEAATPVAQRLPGANLLSGRWRCTNQATGRVTYWEYAATGGVSYYGEDPREAVPLMGPEVPTRWRLQDNVLRWSNLWRGSQWSANNAVLDLSRDFMHYTGAAGESIVCARP